MTQQGYYTNRIKELEKRKDEVTKEFINSKYTLRGINKEIEKCYEYMNSCHYDPKNDMSELEHEIVALKHTIKRNESKIQNLSKKISKKDEKIQYLNEVIQDKDHEIQVLELTHKNELSKMQEKIAELNIKNNESSIKKIDVDVESNLRKENRMLKRDVKALNERIDMMDNTIEKKNKEIQILHERLNWQPVNPKTNIFEEIMEGK